MKPDTPPKTDYSPVIRENLRFNLRKFARNFLKGNIFYYAKSRRDTAEDHRVYCQHLFFLKDENTSIRSIIRQFTDNPINIS